MDARMQQAVRHIMNRHERWIKSMAEQAQRLDDPEAVAAFERQLRELGLRQLAEAQQQLLQARLDAQAEQDRACPSCGAARRHKGRRERAVVGLVGPIRLEGVHWHCDCEAGGAHAVRRLYEGSISPPLRELVCLLGIGGSFARAERQCRKLLGVRLSAKTIRRLTEAQGRRQAGHPAPGAPPGGGGPRGRAPPPPPPPRAEEEARRAAEEAARRAAPEQARRATASAQPPRTVATSEAGRIAVEAALSQLGKPYRWGASGPNSYDCSGLTMWAWRHAGVNLPRVSRMQYQATQRVSRAELRPGDLVFFGSPIHHVAMYIGDGKVVEAPFTGEVVRINSRSLQRSDIAGYGRPG
jgi:cell wall-associated NlpC family hydrolase